VFGLFISLRIFVYLVSANLLTEGELYTSLRLRLLSMLYFLLLLLNELFYSKNCLELFSSTKHNTQITLKAIDSKSLYFLSFCVSNAIHCMGQNMISLAACFGSYKWALVGKCVRISFPYGECVTCRRLVGIPTRNNAKSKRFRLF